MPMLLESPSNHVAEMQWQCELEEAPAASGEAGMELQSQFQAAIRHWLEGREAVSSLEEGNDETGFRFVPFSKVGTIRVRFKPAQPLRPLRYSVDDSE